VSLVEQIQSGPGRDRFQAVLVVAGIDDPDQLDHERIEAQLVVAAIGPDERNRGSRVGMDSTNTRSKATDIDTEILKKLFVGLNTGLNALS